MIGNNDRITQLEREVRELKEQVRAITPMDSQTVTHDRTAHGTIAHAQVPEQQEQPEPALYWL